MERVQLLVQQHDGYLDGGEDELARGAVVHGGNEGPLGLLGQVCRDIDVRLPKIMNEKLSGFSLNN